MKRVAFLWILAISTVAVGCQAQDVVRVALDWTPNTNHTGLLVAEESGFFGEVGLELRLVEPDPNVAVPLVALGRADFGIASQEYVTMARAQGIPIVSVAALFPHNTSGFASPPNRDIESPSDFAGLTYAGWGSEMEELMIRTVMELDGATSSDVDIIDIGTIDFTTAVRLDIADFYWVFYGWQGVNARLQGIAFDFLPLRNLADVLDYYTPVIITREELLDEHPDFVGRFLRAAARGYTTAALLPAASAELLLDYAPELDRELVLASQDWLAGVSITVVEAWGRQEPAVWSAFATWALENGLIDTAIDPSAAFTNDYLPVKEADGG